MEKVAAVGLESIMEQGAIVTILIVAIIGFLYDRKRLLQVIENSQSEYVGLLKANCEILVKVVDKNTSAMEKLEHKIEEFTRG